VRCLRHCIVALDPHSVEGTVDEERRDEEEDERQAHTSARAFRRDLDRELDSENAEERRELDDRVHSDGRGVLEWITNGIANDASCVQRRALLLELDFDELLGVVPSTTGVCHEESLVEAEESDRNEVADEEERIGESEGERAEEDREEDVDHALLRVLRADFDDLLAVFDAGLFSSTLFAV
jgi:hypothetical protein